MHRLQHPTNDLFLDLGSLSLNSYFAFHPQLPRQMELNDRPLDSLPNLPDDDSSRMTALLVADPASSSLEAGYHQAFSTGQIEDRRSLPSLLPSPDIPRFSRETVSPCRSVPKLLK